MTLFEPELSDAPLCPGAGVMTKEITRNKPSIQEKGILVGIVCIDHHPDLLDFNYFNLHGSERYLNDL